MNEITGSLASFASETTTGDLPPRTPRPPDYDVHVRLRSVEKRLKRMEMIIYAALAAVLIGDAEHAKTIGKILKAFFGAE